jgi:tetratricopeptide (TPR) repeat protein
MAAGAGKSYRWSGMSALRYLFSGILLLLMVVAARQGIAAFYFRKVSPASVQKAMAWDPRNPQYPATAANLVHLYGDNADPDVVIRLYEMASRLSPFEAEYYVDRAQANDWAGRSAQAVVLFQRAQDLFPNSPEINWKIANFRVRTGKTSEAWPALKKVLSSGAINENQVFALICNARIDPVTVIDELLPADARAFVDYLNFQVDRGDIAAAQQTWDRLLLLHRPFEINMAFHYLDALIKTRDVERALKIWSALVERFPLLVPSPASSQNLVTNGDFRGDVLNGGFDWRVNPVAGAAVTQETSDSGRDSRSLRIDFDGSQNLYYDSVVQFIATQPNTHYDFSAVLSSEGITTDSGAGLRVFDAYNSADVLGSTDTLTGTMPQSQYKFSFTTGPGTRLVLLTVIRAPSHKFDDKIAGSFRIAKVAIVPHP